MAKEHGAEVQVTIRMPAALHREIKALAEAEHRSMHGQVLMLLKMALDTRRKPPKR
jgi:hypothetical protein